MSGLDSPSGLIGHAPALQATTTPEEPIIDEKDDIPKDAYSKPNGCPKKHDDDVISNTGMDFHDMKEKRLKLNGGMYVKINNGNIFMPGCYVERALSGHSNGESTHMDYNPKDDDEPMTHSITRIDHVYNDEGTKIAKTVHVMPRRSSGAWYVESFIQHYDRFLGVKFHVRIIIMFVFTITSVWGFEVASLFG